MKKYQPCSERKIFGHINSMLRRLKKTIKQYRVLAGLAPVLGTMTCVCTPVYAESLETALALAYAKNPTLKAERSKLRAVDEEVPKALSGYRPTISATGKYTASYGNISPVLPIDELNSWDYSVTLDQPIFRGFRTVNSVKKAENDVLAARQDLKAQEQTILLNAITAYLDVIRDQATLRLQQNNVTVLGKDLQAAEDRFQQGDNTKTDVAQARARRSRALSQLALARSNLKTSRAVYEQLIGSQPGSLKQPRVPTRLLPFSLDEAINIGMKENPSVRASMYREEASRYNIDVIKGELLPEVTLQVSYGESFSDSPFVPDTEEFKVMGRVTVPLYMGGNVSARVRQAVQLNSNSLELITDTRTQSKQQIISAWSNYHASRAQLKSNIEAVKANKIALAGLREQKKQGQRTLLDVLNAEQELLSSQVSVVSTQRNMIVAAYSLLQVVGRLTGENLKIPANLYDPEHNYNLVRNKIWGFGISGMEGIDLR